MESPRHTSAKIGRKAKKEDCCEQDDGLVGENPAYERYHPKNQDQEGAQVHPNAGRHSLVRAGFAAQGTRPSPKCEFQASHSNGSNSHRALNH
jgi:hypothetical protein